VAAAARPKRYVPRGTGRLVTTVWPAPRPGENDPVSRAAGRRPRR